MYVPHAGSTAGPLSPTPSTTLPPVIVAARSRRLNDLFALRDGLIARVESYVVPLP
ncbi:hypothetical protein [Micromonospora sp. NPDC005237]|uniref:hypothetical protein n=1 Tax=unclassified Micromonospora TaxID=2617518 RepID=UPI00339E13E8